MARPQPKANPDAYTMDTSAESSSNASAEYYDGALSVTSASNSDNSAHSAEGNGELVDTDNSSNVFSSDSDEMDDDYNNNSNAVSNYSSLLRV